MFLKLHSATGREVHINMDLIESYGAITHEVYDCDKEWHGMTYLVPILTRDADKIYVVKESPEKIDEMMLIPYE